MVQVLEKQPAIDNHFLIGIEIPVWCRGHLSIRFPISKQGELIFGSICPHSYLPSRGIRASSNQLAVSLTSSDPLQEDFVQELNRAHCLTPLALRRSCAKNTIADPLSCAKIASIFFISFLTHFNTKIESLILSHQTDLKREYHEDASQLYRFQADESPSSLPCKAIVLVLARSIPFPSPAGGVGKGGLIN